MKWGIVKLCGCGYFLLCVWWLTSCGGTGPAPQNKTVTPAPVTAPTPPAPVTPSPPVPTPPVPTTPTITLVGQGTNPLVDEKGELAYSQFGNAVANGQTYLGNLVAYDGHVLTTVVHQTDSAEQVYVDDQLVTQAFQGQVLTLQGAELVAPADALEVTANDTHIAYVDQSCHVVLDGVDIFTDPDGCPLLLVLHGDYLGWCDGNGTYVWHAGAVVNHTFTNIGGVFGFDFHVGNGVEVAWVQYNETGDGSEVWVSNGVMERLSQPVKPGFSGAGNPVYVGSQVAWLDDANGSEPGHFDVYLNGLDLTNSDIAIDELVSGGGVLAWSDESSVWSYQ